MSYLVRSANIKYLNNREKDFLFSEDEDDNEYDFKYVSSNHFKHLVKDVQRQRCKEEEERVWTSFVKQQELNGLRHHADNMHQSSIHSIKQLLHDSMEEADRELKRLEEDALPEHSKRLPRYKTTSALRSNSEVKEPRQVSPQKPAMKDTGTGSTNILLAIPEEEDLSSYERLQDSTRDFKSNLRKSSSDQAMIQKKHSKQLHATNECNYNSSPELSTRRSTEKEDVYVRPDPLTTQRIITMQRKVSELLEEMSFRLEKISPPDGENELKRRQQRVTEFAIRFSRNYLYDLNRYVTDIQRHLCALSPRAKIKPNRRSIAFHMQTVEQKLIAAYQLLLQALIAYCKHIPNSIIKGYSGKLKEILLVVMDLQNICDKLEISVDYFGSGDAVVTPLGKDVRDKCNLILSKLKQNSDTESQAITQEQSIPNCVRNKSRSSRKNLTNRLSMYSADTKTSRSSNRKRLKDCYQKEKKQSTADTKAVSSNCPQIPNQLTTSPVTDTSSKEIIPECSRHKMQTKEDDIKTIMDTIPLDSDNASPLELQGKYNNASVGQKNKVLKKYSPEIRSSKGESGNRNRAVKPNIDARKEDDLVKKVTMITEERLSSLVPVLADLMSLLTTKQNEVDVRPVSAASMETLLEFVQKYQSPKTTGVKERSKFSKRSNRDHMTPNNTHGKYKNGKNMQLICVSTEKNNEPRYCDVSCQATSETLKEFPEFGTKINENRRHNSTSEDGIQLVISEAAEARFMEYRSEYQRLCRLSPMYSSNTQNKPWDIVAWISDKLVDELISEIAKELQMDDVIQKLFEMEFQEF